MKIIKIWISDFKMKLFSCFLITANAIDISGCCQRLKITPSQTGIPQVFQTSGPDFHIFNTSYCNKLDLFLLNTIFYIKNYKYVKLITEAKLWMNTYIMTWFGRSSLIRTISTSSFIRANTRLLIGVGIITKFQASTRTVRLLAMWKLNNLLYNIKTVFISFTFKIFC